MSGDYVVIVKGRPTKNLSDCRDYLENLDLMDTTYFGSNDRGTGLVLCGVENQEDAKEIEEGLVRLLFGAESEIQVTNFSRARENIALTFPQYYPE